MSPADERDETGDVRTGRRDWDELRQRQREVRARWEAVVAEVDRGVVTPGRREDAEWGAWHVMNHVASYLDAAAKMLELLGRGERVVYPPAQKWLGDGLALEAVDAALAGGWERYAAALEAAAAADASSGTVTHVIAGTMDARAWVSLGQWHLGDHTRQLAGIDRGSGRDSR